MSKPAFTPGPWRVDATVALGAYGVWTAYPTHPGHDGQGYESQICSVLPHEIHDVSREQRDANAALIAAAPDLYAALVDLLERAEALNEAASGQPFDAAPFAAGLIANARAALAAATGNETEGKE